MATNLFKAAKSESAPKAKKSDKLEVIVKDKDLEANIKKLAKVNEQLDSLAAEAKELTNEIKPRLQEEFIKQYNKDGKYPGSFNLVAGSSSVMVIPTDRYITIDKERKEELVETYGKEIAEEKDTYIMDAEMIEKYGDIISELILKCKKIAEEDKAKLIRVETKYTVKKGTISVLLEKFKKFSITDLVEDIRPVFQMKNIKG